jgi:hypothetical protein
MNAGGVFRDTLFAVSIRMMIRSEIRCQGYTTACQAMAILGGGDGRTTAMAILGGDGRTTAGFVGGDGFIDQHRDQA